MRKRWSLSGSQRTLAALVLSVSGVLVVCPAVMSVKAAPIRAQPAPLPKEVVRAWQNAGAKVGWMGDNEYARLTFGRAGETNVLPNLSISQPIEGRGFVEAARPRDAVRIEPQHCDGRRAERIGGSEEPAIPAT